MSYQFDKVRILIVDDCSNMRYLLREFLQVFGFQEVHEAGCGHTALDMVRQIEPEIIICDYKMEPMDGLQFVKTLRSDLKSKCRFVPIIMLTGHTEMKRILEARDAGATEYLAKPISPQALFKRIEAVIEAPRDFVQTRSFFGPDRRRSSLDDWAGLDRRNVEYL